MAHVLPAGEERMVESSFIPPHPANLEGTMHPLHNEMECYRSSVHISFCFGPTALDHGLKSESPKTGYRKYGGEAASTVFVPDLVRQFLFPVPCFFFGEYEYGRFKNANRTGTGRDFSVPFSALAVLMHMVCCKEDAVNF
jgi:hypothetical protein